MLQSMGRLGDLSRTIFDQTTEYFLGACKYYWRKGSRGKCEIRHLFTIDVEPNNRISVLRGKENIAAVTYIRTLGHGDFFCFPDKTSLWFEVV